MQKPLKNYAFIDSQNVNLGVQDLGWKLDWLKFRIYLKEKYAVEKAYMFMGYLKENQKFYNSLINYGYTMIFKEIIKNKHGKIKGNCDAELVLQAMIDYNNYEKCIIATGDGDFACLVKYLKKQGKLEKLIVPNINKYSVLLKKASGKELYYLNELQQILSWEK